MIKIEQNESIEKCTETNIKNVLDLPYVDGISFDILVRDINNETYSILLKENEPLHSSIHMFSVNV